VQPLQSIYSTAFQSIGTVPVNIYLGSNLGAETVGTKQKFPVLGIAQAPLKGDALAPTGLNVNVNVFGNVG